MITAVRTVDPLLRRLLLRRIESCWLPQPFGLARLAETQDEVIEGAGLTVLASAGRGQVRRCATARLR